MNTNGLAQHYHCLSPWERLPLLVSASARGDDVEHDRLARSAPKLCFGIPNYWGLAEGLQHLAACYALEQLDLAAFYWRVETFLEQDALLDKGKETRKRDQRLWKAAKTMAYRFVVRADGWKLLCAELHLDADSLLQKLPGYENLRHMEELARAIACSPEEAVANLREAEKRLRPAAAQREYHIDTAEDVARSMRTFLDEQLTSWS